MTACAECSVTIVRIEGVFKDAIWLPRRGGMICKSCGIRCACGAIVPSLNPFDATTDRVMCQSCVRQRLGPSAVGASDRLAATQALERQQQKSAHAQKIGTPIAKELSPICRMSDPYFVTGADDPDLVETSWPIPGERLGEVEHRLRYLPQASLTRGDILVAAEVIAAYGALLMKSARDRNKYAAALARVMRKRGRAAPTGSDL